LADRAIFLTLGPITEQQRRPEMELRREFERNRPSILGALLDIVAHGLRTFSGVRIKRWPRMADFAHWGTACESAFAPPGTFLRAYRENRRAARDGVLDADPVATRVRELSNGPCLLVHGLTLAARHSPEGATEATAPGQLSNGRQRSEENQEILRSPGRPISLRRHATDDADDADDADARHVQLMRRIVSIVGAKQRWPS
jgi:hypothetical protein